MIAPVQDAAVEAARRALWGEYLNVLIQAEPVTDAQMARLREIMAMLHLTVEDLVGDVQALHRAEALVERAGRALVVVRRD